MKSLLNITVFASAVLSIFSTSLTLYEVPELKEALLIREEEKSNYESNAAKDLKRIYISHDVSGTSNKKSEPTIVTKDTSNVSKSAEDSINVFGVKVVKNHNYRNI